MTIRLGILGATRGLNFALAAVEYKLDLEVAEDPEMPLLIEHLNDWDLYLEALQTVRQLAHS